jgi:aerobic carbon-monoxide dehydrogenase small subunit
MMSQRSFALETVVNGRPYALEVGANELLLDVLRNRLGLTATKLSCGIEICGACTVLLDGRPVSACCTLAWEARGRHVETAEGLAVAGRLHPLQQAFMDHFALQCGYCTPGMLMTLRALLDEEPRPTEQQIRESLKGNICRCTGYQAIIEATRAAAETMTSTGGKA